jgi:hypothetical protein
MRMILTSATFWRFLGGFAVGGVGVMALHPAGATPFAAPQAVATAAINLR